MQIDPNASGALAGAVNAATAQANAPATAQANAQAPALATSRTPRWFRHAAARRETAAPWAGRMLKHGMVRAQPVRGAWLSRIRAALQQRADRAEHGAQLRHEALRPTEGSLPVRGKFGWLSRLGLVRQRLQGTVVNLQAQQAAAADALALSRVSSAMQQRFAASASDAGAFNATLRQAFGDKFDAAKAETLRQQALAGDFSWAPKVQIASAQQLSDLSGTQAADGAARGAYVQAEDTIYISRETLHGDADTAQRLLMEELGHAIDARINTVDSAGDEGEIFAKLMHGDAVSAQQLADMKADNDHGTVMLNGRSVQVEYGWFKKLRKAISGGFKKVVKAVVKGTVGLVKSTFKVATGLMTLNFQRVREGFKQGVQAVKTTVKAVVQAVKETTKAVISAVKEGFKQLMQSKLFAAVLMICRFIPIPVVQLAVRIVDVVRAAYMAYQGIKNKSWGAVLGAVASVAGGAANIAGSLGASASTVANIQAVASAASKLNMAYNAIANKDIGAALSLAGGAFGSGTQASSTLATLQTVGGYVQQGLAVRAAVRGGDALGALSGTLGLASGALGKDHTYAGQIATASEVVTGLRAVQALSQGNLDAAQSLTQGMASAQAASQQADEISARQRAAEQAQLQAKADADADTEAQAALAKARQADAGETPAAVAASDTAPAALAPDDSPPSTAATPSAPATTVVSRGQTLEAIARANYGDHWRAGLAQMAIDNGLKLNQWGSPMLRVGQELVMPDLGGRSDADLAALARTGGRLIASNSNGLAVKAELEQRAREAAAAKIAEANALAQAQTSGAWSGGFMQASYSPGMSGSLVQTGYQGFGSGLGSGSPSLYSDASNSVPGPGGVWAAGQHWAGLGRQTLVDNPILIKRWEGTTSAWTGKGGFTSGLTNLLEGGGIEVADRIHASPAGSLGPRSGVSSGVANNVNGALAEQATAARYSSPGTVVSTQQPRANGRIVDVVVDVPAADPRYSQRIEIESKVGRTGLDGATGHITSEALRDAEALRVNRTVRQAGNTLEVVGRVARPVGLAMDVIEIGQAYRADGNRIGQNTGRAASGVAGGALGGWGGAAAGAAIGTAILPGVGTAIGAIIGGVGGAWGGDAAGRATFDTVRRGP
ncbi:hypothetical protein [Aquabacterium sp. OR-4]|uniref:hypothetical protein n=1 Tax=Aquabacterium sp. OR-4 TaxID=2978127 RepID=UPI0028CA09AC|nr:hypothetical protein [Aquabacterium sp. OR-4]MDT7836062.1 hypothetical protein [Aquabacterium sp. OR-4]